MGMNPPQEKDGHHSETLEKGLRILNLFNEEGHGFSLTEISRSIGVNKTSVYRYINTFCELGYLRREGRTRMVRLGPVALALAHAFIQGSDLVGLIKPLVDEVHSAYNLHIDVGLLHGEAIYPVYRREAKDTLAYRHFTTARGIHCLATGKAALAFLGEAERDSLIQRLELNPKTERTITDRRVLEEDLALTRERGYSINNEEFIPGLIALGAPLYNLHTSRVVGGVSFDASTAHIALEKFEESYSGLLVELAKKISAVIPKD